MTARTPFLFVHWLEDPDDEREAASIADVLKGNANVQYEDVSSRVEFERVLLEWSTDNGAAQYVFLGCHGDKEGIGDFTNTGMNWPELGDLFAGLPTLISLWLFACESAHAAAGWSGRVTEPVRWLVGFKKKHDPSEFAPILEKLVELNGPDKFHFIDREIALVKQASGSVPVELYYPVVNEDGVVDYVEVEEFSNRTGMSFRDYLVKQNEEASEKNREPV